MAYPRRSCHDVPMTDAAPEFSAYEAAALAELRAWEARMTKPPGPWDRATRNMQDSINRIIPEKVHQAVTATLEQVTRGILTGSTWTTAQPLLLATLAEREDKVRKAIQNYRAVAAAEGGVAGAGGFVLAAAEFPVLLSTKIKLLFDIAALYGRRTEAWSERLFILSVFQLAFSSAQHRVAVFEGMRDWDARHAENEPRPEDFDWRSFQQQYRDYIDLAKLAQLIPVVGAPIGVVVNWRLVERLGECAINGYRARWFAREGAPSSPS